MKKEENKSISNLENQKVDSDKIVGGRKEYNEGFAAPNDKHAASRTFSEENKPGENKMQNSIKTKFNREKKF